MSSHRIVLVQVSDLHFSREYRNRTVDWIGGYRGHEHALTQALPAGRK